MKSQLLNFAAIISQKGSDAWWYMTVEELLPDKYRDRAAEYEKGTDTMDVWFDSGIMRLLVYHYIHSSILFISDEKDFYLRFFVGCCAGEEEQP